MEAVVRYAGKRLEFCVMCGCRLPDGSRIDRKYCRAACIERAYYQRHPDKKRIPGARLSTARAAAPSASQPSLAPVRVPISVTVPAATAPPVPSDDQPTLDHARKEIERLQQELRAMEEQKKQLQAALTALRAQHQAVSSVRTVGATSVPHQQAVSPSQARQLVKGAPAKAAESSGPIQKQSPPPVQASPLPATPKPNPKPVVTSGPIQPWEYPPRRPGERPVPKWQSLASSTLGRVRRYSERMLSLIPRYMQEAGSKQDATYIRLYLTAGTNRALFKKLCFPMLLRIGCTEERHRTTEQQCETLAVAVLEDSLNALIEEGYSRAVELRRELETDPRHLRRFALELVSGCRGWEIRLT